MRYYGDIYRAPSEASSLLLQVTVGCSHNKCTFCYMYKNKQFRMRPLEELKEDIRVARKEYSYVKRVFLIDGDALVVNMRYLIELLDYIGKIFPECERVGTSATAEDILRKSPEELTLLQEKGLKIIYMGVESGSDKVLKKVNKGTDSARLILAGQRARSAGIKLSVSLITGLGGKEFSEDHARETARVLNGIDPDYIGLLTLILHEQAPLRHEVEAGELELLDSKESIEEIRLLVENLEVSGCTFRGNHASNYTPLKASLPQEKDRLLHEIDMILIGETQVKPDYLRRL